ncbi:MAG: mobA [Ignavibacteria bacterium]|nr:mobA [Ignavibacteria bacterium]
MYKDITGIILSGGKSQRMGVNKSFLPFGSVTIIEHMLNLMKSVFEDNILITNEPESYERFNIPTYPDIYKNIGPLGGIHSGLSASSTEKNFVISCDIPMMTKEIIQFISDYQSSAKIIVAKADGFIQQLCGVYNRSCLTMAEDIIKHSLEQETRDVMQVKRKCKVLTLLDVVGAEIIDIEKECKDYKSGAYFNINKPEDYQKIQGFLQ